MSELSPPLMLGIKRALGGCYRLTQNRGALGMVGEIIGNKDNVSQVMEAIVNAERGLS